MSAVIIPVVGNGVVTTLDDLLKVLPVGAQNLQWMVSCDFEVVANEERARARAEAIYALADRAQPVPFENLVALAAAGVQVIDGELVAFGQDGEDPLLSSDRCAETNGTSRQPTPMSSRWRLSASLAVGPTLSLGFRAQRSVTHPKCHFNG